MGNSVGKSIPMCMAVLIGTFFGLWFFSDWPMQVWPTAPRAPFFVIGTIFVAAVLWLGFAMHKHANEG